MDAEWPPAPPEGYRKHDPEYVQPWYVTAGLGVWLVAVLVGVPALVIGVHGFGTAVAIIREVFLFQIGTGELVLYVGWVGATLAILFGGHEALHALAGRWFGLEAEFHLDYSFPLDVTPSVVTYGEFQSRSESIAITLAPLIVMTPLSIIVLIVAQQPWLIASAAWVAVGNSAGAAADLASAWVLWNLPADELVHHDSDGWRQYYTPKS
jgi:hypothetical protein